MPRRPLSLATAALILASAITATVGAISTVPSQAAAGDPFPVGQGLVFVSQGDPTRLFKAVQGSGAITFSPEGPVSGGRYNAIAFRESDRYIYAMRQPDSRNLLRIGQLGQVTGLGPVIGMPVDDYNQGTFGTGAFANTMFVRSASTNNVVRLVNVDTVTATTLTLSQNVPNVSDLVFTQGFLWSVYGEGQQIYRINPTTGAVSVFSIAGQGIAANPYGAQWVYGNGNIGISNNVSGNVYQVVIANPAAATPTFTFLPRVPGPGSTNNDGTAYAGVQADLAVDKSAPATFTAGGAVVYTITVTNNGPGVSSGWQITDAIPAGLSNVTTTSVGCSIITGTTFTCAGGTLPVGQAATISFSGSTGAGQTACITNSATVIGNEEDPVGGNNTDDAETCPGVAVASFSVQKTASTLHAHTGDTVTYTLRVTNTGGVAYTAANPATFSDDLSGVLDDAVYNDDAAPPVATFTEATSTVNWSGAVPVGGHVDVTYSVTVQDVPADFTMDNTVTPGPGGSCLVAEQCVNVLPIAAFHVAKTASASTADPGSTVLYTIEVENIGQFAYTDAEPASFADDLSDVLDDGELDVGSITGGAEYSAPQLSWEGPLGVGETVTITYEIDVNAPVSGDQTMTNTVVTPPDSGANCAEGSTDPDCQAVVIVEDEPADLTVIKSSSSDFVPGGTVVFTVTVTNNGPGPSSGWTITDQLPLSTGFGGVAGASCTISGNELTCEGDALGVGESVTATISGTTALDAPECIENSVTVVGNEVDPNTGNDSSTAESCQGVETPAFTVQKSASVAVARPGDTVTYTVRVVNSGPVAFTDATPASFEDDLSDVLDNATIGAIDPELGFADPILSWSGPLAVGGLVEFSYSVTVGAASGDNLLTNIVTPGDSGECATETACSIDVPLASYTVQKSADPPQTFPGGTVTYTITVTNTGGYAYTGADPASFEDDLSDVLETGSLVAGSITGGALYGAPVISWSGPLDIGAVVEFGYAIEVNAAGLGDGVLTNTVVTPDGSGGGCPAADPPPECTAEVPVMTYTVEKTATVDQSDPAAIVVRYEVTVTNTGAVDFVAPTLASFSDDLTGVLDDASYNGDGSAGTTFASPQLSWSGEVPTGSSVTVTYSVTVNDPVEGDHHLVNVVLPTGNGGTCTSAADCTTDTPVRAYTAVKSVSADTVHPGDIVTYTITLTNTGGTAYTAELPATFTDDLTDDLLHAVYNGDATGATSYSEPVLTWSGAIPYPGSVVISYTLTVGDFDASGTMTNSVVTGPDGNCTPDEPEEPQGPAIAAESSPLRAADAGAVLVAEAAAAPSDDQLPTLAMGPECTAITVFDPSDPQDPDLAATGANNVMLGWWIAVFALLGGAALLGGPAMLQNRRVGRQRPPRHLG